MQLQKTIASVAGIGYLKGGGTVASVVYCIIWFLLPAGFSNSAWQVVTAIFVLIVGVWCANAVEKDWGEDSSKVVIDEVAGMAITLLFVPPTVVLAATGLLLFRFFDIAKPLGVRQMEKLPKGWGVMGDDLLAGIYALVVMQAIMWLAAFYGK